MHLNKNDYHILNHLLFYRWLSIVSLAFGIVLTSLHASFFIFSTKHDRWNNALVGASMCVSGLSFVMYNLVRLVEKLSGQIKAEKSGGVSP